MKSIHLLYTTLLVLLFSHILFAQGKVYFVLGSDTGIWDGMDVSEYACTYSLSLFTDPARNATRVMDPAFRLPLTDSYGTPVKLTWWMMAGNIFRHATNVNVPHPNTMTLYLMKKYQGEYVRQWGDELTLHYHTFVWSDYDGDGKYYWNQALSFSESSDDFDVTLAEMLLEEETFPVSFRSGWHAMDNGWQQRLDTLLPYCLHNDWPAKHTDLTEPLDNTYDWSRAPSTFIPFHPSPTDYQVPGSCRGWNVRSMYMSGADSVFMDGVFAQAAAGVSQVVCLWAHLPETDFLDNVRKVNTSAHAMASRFPAVKFRYCTAVEAMQQWRGTTDTVRPYITFEEINQGDMARWKVTSDEPIFQPSPFVAAKDRYGEYHVLSCSPTGDRSWETTVALVKSDLAKVGVAATDTAGNLSTAIIRYLPDDIIVDNSDPAYAELSGSWATSQNASWGTTSRVTTLGASDSAKVEWSASIAVSCLYNVYAQIPAVQNSAQTIEFRVMEGTQAVSTSVFTAGVPGNRWVYLGTPLLTAGASHSVVMVARSGSQAGTQASADVVKFSALVRDRWLVAPDILDAGELIVQEESTKRYTFRNEGILPVELSSATSTGNSITLTNQLPVTIPAMGEVQLDFTVVPPVVGALNDTLVLVSDDPHHALVRIPVKGTVLEYFALVDDRDSLFYSETGAWYFSVAEAYGPTSRYAYPAPGVSATYRTALKKSGVYQIQEIVPTTINASVRARYVLSVNGARVDSAFIDQNAGSGAWVTVMEHAVPAGGDTRVEITDAMSPVISGMVLRADAIRFQWINDGSSDVTAGHGNLPEEYTLAQNYPNPFNPATTIAYSIPASRASGVGGMETKLVVYDILGREVAVLVNERKAPGNYSASFNAAGLSTGVYFYRLTAGSFVRSKTMLLVK